MYDKFFKTHAKSFEATNGKVHFSKNPHLGNEVGLQPGTFCFDYICRTNRWL